MTPNKNPSDKTVSYDKENLLKRKLEEVVLNGNFLKLLLKRKLNYSESKYIDFLLYILYTMKILAQNGKKTCISFNCRF